MLPVSGAEQWRTIRTHLRVWGTIKPMSELLSIEALEHAMRELHVAWSVIPGQGLVRVFEVADFSEGLALVASIGALAEKAGHYPEITLRRDKLEVICSTPEAGGVTQQDIDLAQAIDHGDTL